MQRFSFLFSTRIRFTDPVSAHSFLLRCLPCNMSSQKVVDAKLTVDGADLHHGTDAFGNRISWGLISESHNSFSFTAEGVVDVRPYRVCAAPSPMYGSCTALTSCTRAMREFALFGAGRGGDLERAVSLSKALHGLMKYQAGATSVCTTAAEAFGAGVGVCQDYAHILIAMCREVGIEARYVTGYMHGEGATHAWVEIFSRAEGVWYGLDPTNNCSIGLGYIKVAHGRDADDCPVSRGVMSGVTSQNSEISVKVRPVYD
ncbi:MAG: transglutaminase family protein [Desulfovibrionaceae bacterium]|nr:transglutaminase family protein [Desulfovibrionaceae bacterium]